MAAPGKARDFLKADAKPRNDLRGPDAGFERNPPKVALDDAKAGEVKKMKADRKGLANAKQPERVADKDLPMAGRRMPGDGKDRLGEN